MRTLTLPRGAGPRERGRVHGESFRNEIGALADIRGYLARRIGGFASDGAVLELAERHLPVLRDYDRELFEELCGIAEGAATTAARIVVLNHYTDLRDIDPSAIGPSATGPSAVGARAEGADASASGSARSTGGDDSGGCSVLYANTPEGPVLAQTWDMHATAIPYTMMLKIPEGEGEPEAWLLTLTGCLGMCGLNARGLGVAINNLHSLDARVGVVWPALVRRLLREESAPAARDRVLESPVGSGHHYFAADGAAAYGVETSGLRREVVFSAKDEVYVHTNHCTSEEVGEVTRIPATSSTVTRSRRLWESARERPVEGPLDAWARLGDQRDYPQSVCGNLSTPENPHGTATCAGIAMDLGRGRAYAQGGFIHNVEPDNFDLASGADGAVRGGRAR